MDTRADQEATKDEVTCPYCGSTDTEIFSLFGQQLLTVQYYCNACHTPFEHIKDDEVLNRWPLKDALSPTVFRGGASSGAS